MIADMAPSQPRMEVTRNAASQPRLIHYSPGSFTDLAGSDENAKSPIVAGVWNCDDVENGSEIIEAEWDEVKYVLTGQALWQDADSGLQFTTESGSLIWFPAGSRSILISCKDLSAFYVEQTHRLPFSAELPQDDLDDKLDSLLKSLQTQYIHENPRSQEAHEKAKQYLPGGNTRSVLYYEPFPLSLTTGHECFVVSKDNHVYLDFVSEYSACMFGHSNAEIRGTIQRTLELGMNLGGPGDFEVELAEALVKRFRSIEKIRFCNSGTEANTIALSVAKAFTNRKKVLVFRNGYHGGFLSFASESNPLNIEFDFVFGQYNDIDSTRDLIDRDVAAVLVEPMQGAGGMIPADKAFLQSLRDLATKHGAILIFDEIITSRLHIDGLQGYYGIKPDMTTLGKYLGGGFSFGAFGGREDIMSILEPGSGLAHSGTYNNNSFSMSAGVKAASLLTAEAIAQANALGDQLRVGINQLASEYGFSMLSATGFGSAVGLHFIGPHSIKLRDAFFFFMLSRRIYVGRRGFLSLNTVHQQEHVDQMLRNVDNFLTQLIPKVR